MAAGIIGCFISSMLMNKFKTYKLLLVISVVCGVASYFFLFVIVRTQYVPLVFTSAALMGFFAIPSRGLVLAFQCEVAYPVSK